MTWQGVIIEESLEDKTLLDMTRIVGTRETFLEEEENKGIMHLHSIEIENYAKELFVERAKSSIRQGWYIHICKNSTMVVIFRGKSFEFSEGQKEKIEEAQKYGESVGIHPAQLPSENLIRNPFD